MRLYIADDGETLKDIADRQNITLEKLTSLNSHVSNPNENIFGCQVNLPPLPIHQIEQRHNTSSRQQRSRKAIIVAGGWEPHKPMEIAEILARLLKQENFEVEIVNTWEVFNDRAKVMQMDLIVPNWTEGTITPQQLDNFLDAVNNGTGVAGMHGGMGYTFPTELRYQFMVGGVFVTHPGTRFKVEITNKAHPITRGLSDFEVIDEHYYMLLDPAIEVLATSYYESYPPEVSKPVYMPIVWTKKYGKGRVFYNSIGHSPEILLMPEVLTLMRRGMAWAAR
ncbi:ThuA domain-containing protein [Bacillus solitudinis]|uniref:ThuA domain-containing protein n=1 Tax=Bacillus solitudinis TaxID=2014074 RepID=UPI000C250036|nr:ThuA domain-containing protein [Bacillus solitudinis]